MAEIAASNIPNGPKVSRTKTRCQPMRGSMWFTSSIRGGSIPRTTGRQTLQQYKKSIVSHVQNAFDGRDRGSKHPERTKGLAH